MTGQRPRVLVIDDDALQLDLVERSLRREGFEVECVSDSSAIFDRIRRFEPSIVLLDLSVPGASGGLAVDVARRAAPPDMRLFLYSASDDSHLRALAKKHNTDGWISKSQPVTELARRLRDLGGGGGAISTRSKE